MGSLSWDASPAPFHPEQEDQGNTIKHLWGGQTYSLIQKNLLLFANTKNRRLEYDKKTEKNLMPLRNSQYESIKDLFMGHYKNRTIESMLVAFKTYNEMNISEMQRIYFEDENPLILWSTIAFCLCSPEIRYNCLRPVNSHQKDYDLFNFAVTKSEKVIPFPDWCNSYLSNCADGLLSLEIDFEESRNPKMTPQKAVATLPRLFGFVKMGRNAFLVALRRNARDNLAMQFNELRETEGLSITEAKKILLDQTNFAEMRSLQRVLARCRAPGDQT